MRGYIRISTSTSVQPNVIYKGSIVYDQYDTDQNTKNSAQFNDKKDIVMIKYTFQSNI
jgi:hypothetical protein